ncbi:Bacterial Ig-like domain (group 2) [uncultured archaeon]|nr:Bacterial Ig-like domain (group 2) [uncultured archaeon]
MNRKKISLGLLFLAVALVALPGASASTTYYGDLQSIYGGPAPPTCVADCHSYPGFVFTPYGNAFAAIQTHRTDPTSALISIGPPLATITVTPATASLTFPGTQLFTAATFDPFGNQINAAVTWTSSNTAAVGTIDSAGLFTATGAGTTTITATGGGTGSGIITGTATATVSAPAAVLTTITVTPATASLTAGGSQTFTAAGFDQSGAPIAISPAVVWSSSDIAVGTIDETTGAFNALAAGTTTITAKNGTSGTVSGTATVTVTAASLPVLTTITVTPARASLAIGGSQTFSAAGFDQSGAPIAISPAVVWSSSNPAVGTIDATTGLFNALAAGRTTITAKNGTSGTVSGTATLTVKRPRHQRK